MLRKCICTVEFLIPICQFLELSALVMCHLKTEGGKNNNPQSHSTNYHLGNICLLAPPMETQAPWAMIFCPFSAT